MRARTILLGIASPLLLILALSSLVVARESVWHTGQTAPATSRLGTEVKISVDREPECHRYRSDIAFNYVHDEYLVVWHNTWPDDTRQVYGRRMSTTGQPVTAPFLLSRSPNDKFHPAVAYNHTNDEYLVVWMYDVSGDGSRYEIWGRVIPWNCTGPGEDFAIGNWSAPYDMWEPSVAWGTLHNEYMVIWDTYNTTTSQPINIGRRRVAADGTPGGGAEITTANYPHYSDIAYNIAKDEYLVVWVRSYSDIYGARLSWNGTITRTDFAINSWTDIQQYPALTTNEQNRYMVAWERQFNTSDWDILGQELDVNGDQVGVPMAIASTGDVELHVDVTSNGAANEWLAAWQRTTAAGDTIWATRWDSEAVPSVRFEVAFAAFWNHRYPAVAADIPGYFIVYEGRAADPTQYQHIYGRMWWPEALYIPLILRNH